MSDTPSDNTMSAPLNPSNAIGRPGKHLLMLLWLRPQLQPAARFASRLILAMLVLALGLPASLHADDCLEDPAQTPYNIAFDSGARWELCWSIDEATGLNLHQVGYGAPGHETVRVLDSASLAQLAVHYHEDNNALPLIPAPGLGGAHHLNDHRSSCATENRVYNSRGELLCHVVANINTLTSTRRQHALRRHSATLSATSLINHRWVKQAWHLTEDGEIEPFVAVGGKINRLTYQTTFGADIGQGRRQGSTADVVTVWRLNFAINNTRSDDIIETFEFYPSAFITDETNNNTLINATDDSTNGVADITGEPHSDITRDMRVHRIRTETAQFVNRQRFKGWRVRDGERLASNQPEQTIGYYLDPQTAGFVNRPLNDASLAADLVITRTRDCERIAYRNRTLNKDCADGLRDYLNNEPLDGQGISLWYSLTRSLKPTANDYPFWPLVTAQFKLVPFDWTDQSPFTPQPR